jgi:hypothetical protein
LTTYNSQSTYILPVHGLKNAYIFMADRWNPENPIDGKYIWLPVEINNNRIEISWRDKWNLDFFN